MFTGIVEATGRIVESCAVAGGRRMRLEAGAVADGCRLGDSVCVQGVCLTVAGVAGGDLSFDVIAETLQRSTLGQKRVGDRLNLERSLRLGDRLDGHWVQGHVDGQATVVERRKSAEEHVVFLRPDPVLTPYIVPKGSISIDGVSMTIAELRGGDFSIALIPTTVDRTTLGALAKGDAVNLETDIVARTIVHRMEQLDLRGGFGLGAMQAADGP